MHACVRARVDVHACGRLHLYVHAHVHAPVHEPACVLVYAHTWALVNVCASLACAFTCRPNTYVSDRRLHMYACEPRPRDAQFRLEFVVRSIPRVWTPIHAMGLHDLFGGSCPRAAQTSRRHVAVPGCRQKNTCPRAANAQPKPRGATAKRKGACLRPPVAAVQSSKASSGWPVCHAEPSQTCAQCRFQRFREQWVRLYGSHEAVVHGRRARMEWLVVRPVAWGGNWGVGCSVCARVLFRMGLTGKEAGSRERKWSTKFGRYVVRALSAMQAETFKSHASQI